MIHTVLPSYATYQQNVESDIEYFPRRVWKYFPTSETVDGQDSTPYFKHIADASSDFLRQNIRVQNRYHERNVCGIETTYVILPNSLHTRDI